MDFMLSNMGELEAELRRVLKALSEDIEVATAKQAEDLTRWIAAAERFQEAEDADRAITAIHKAWTAHPLDWGRGGRG